MERKSTRKRGPPRHGSSKWKYPCKTEKMQAAALNDEEYARRLYESVYGDSSELHRIVVLMRLGVFIKIPSEYHDKKNLKGSGAVERWGFDETDPEFKG